MRLKFKKDYPLGGSLCNKILSGIDIRIKLHLWEHEFYGADFYKVPIPKDLHDIYKRDFRGAKQYKYVNHNTIYSKELL